MGEVPDVEGPACDERSPVGAARKCKGVREGQGQGRECELRIVGDERGAVIRWGGRRGDGSSILAGQGDGFTHCLFGLKRASSSSFAHAWVGDGQEGSSTVMGQGVF